MSTSVALLPLRRVILVARLIRGDLGRLPGGDRFVWAVRENGATTWTCYNDRGAKVPMHNYGGNEGDPPNVVAHRGVRQWDVCTGTPGEFHPRMWRGPATHAQDDYNELWAGSYSAVSTLVRRMREVFYVVEPNDFNEAAYGHEIRHLLILAATEVETAWRAILRANGYPGNIDRLTTNDYVKLHTPMRLAEWQVQLIGYPRFGEIAPFGAWDVSKPTQSLSWYDAYNSAKHDRENNFQQATLKHAIYAVAAAYIMTLAQFGIFDMRQQYGLDEFHQVRKPRFPRRDWYVPPFVNGDPDAPWIPRPYFGAAPPVEVKEIIPQ